MLEDGRGIVVVVMAGVVVVMAGVVVVMAGVVVLCWQVWWW